MTEQALPQVQQMPQPLTDAEAQTEIVLVSTGHTALDSRVFDKEAVSLAKVFPRVRVVATHPGADVRDGVAITGLPASRNRLERFLFRPLRCLLAARGAGARVLILHDVELLWWVPLLKLMTGWRIIYDAHEDYAPLMLQRGWIPAPLRLPVSRMMTFFEKIYSSPCDGIIGVTASLVEKFHHRRQVALYNLPSLTFIRTAAEGAKPLADRQYDLVHLGTLSAERLEFLKAVLRALFAGKPEARVLLIGVRPGQQASFSSAFPPERVTILGLTPYQQLASLLGDCRVGIDVHPVLHPHLRCAVPVKVFEYMAAGLNVVTSVLPELHRLLDSDGMEHVVSIDTADAGRFAGEVVRLLEHPKEMERHQRALMNLLHTRWNWESEAEKLIRFVRCVIQQTEFPEKADTSHDRTVHQ